MKQVLDLLLIVLSLSFCYNVKYECSVNDLIACEMKQYGLAYVYSCNCYPKLIPNLIPENYKVYKKCQDPTQEPVCIQSSPYNENLFCMCRRAF